MRLKFEARKAEVDTGNNALSEINWNKNYRKRRRKQCNQYKEKMQENPDKMIRE